MSESFWVMGGYGAYVWPSYGLAAVVMLVLFVASLRRASAATQRLKQLQSLAAPATEKDAS